MPEPITYVPAFRRPLGRPINAPTAWNGIEQIIPALIDDFGITLGAALEFGVGDGFSTVALANYFGYVIGVDTFEGDVHAGSIHQNFDRVRESLSRWPNILLHQSRYQNWIEENSDCYRFDLIHIDIVHTFEDTYACGLWAVEHGDCIVFHDTLSFPDVHLAVEALALHSGRTFYNFPESHGLGILSAKGKI